MAQGICHPAAIARLAVQEPNFLEIGECFTCAAHTEDLVVPPGGQAEARGLWTRLNSHASGRRSGDQFNVYICDRFVVPALTRDQLCEISQGRLPLDQMTRSFIHEHLAYRCTVYGDGTEALAVERAVRAGSLAVGRPYLNPL